MGCFFHAAPFCYSASMRLIAGPAVHYSALVITLLCAGVIVTFPVFDYDLYWHLANGREMLTQQRIINEEVFSYTKPGVPFSNHEWLSQLILFFIYQQAGWFGLMLFKYAMVLATAGFLFTTCRMLGAHPIACGVLCATAILAGAYRYNIRPELFSLLFMTVIIYLGYGYREGRLSMRGLYLLPVIMVVWDWLHGAVFGVVFLAAFTVGENATGWLSPRFTLLRGMTSMASERLRGWNVAMVITLIAMLAHPYGLLSYGIFFEFLGDNPLVRQVKEFSAPNLQNYTAFWILLGFSVLLLALYRRRLHLTHVLTLLPFLYLSLRYSRATGVFALVAAPVLASLLARTLEDGVPAAQARLKNIWVGALALAITIDAVYVKVFKPQDLLGFGYHVIEEGFPAGALRFVKDVGLHGNLYNSGDFGGYLSFHLPPERKIFQYNHHTVFGDTRYYLDHPQELARWNINYALIAHGAERRILFPPEQWALLYSEPVAMLLVRRTPENAPLIERYEIRYFEPLRLNYDDLARLANDPAIYPRLMHEMATYLSYRSDPLIAEVFAQFIAAPQASLPITERLVLLGRVANFNGANAAVRQAREHLQKAFTRP